MSSSPRSKALESIVRTPDLLLKHSQCTLPYCAVPVAYFWSAEDSIRKHNKGLPRVDGRVCGFFMFLFYTFQQPYRYPRIAPRTLEARAAAKCRKPGDEQK